jgi:hypothetical protein
VTTEDAKSCMLEEAEAQFRFYAEQHDAKVARFESDLDSGIDDGTRAGIQLLLDDTRIKAEVNRDFANRCAAARKL